MDQVLVKTARFAGSKKAPQMAEKPAPFISSTTNKGLRITIKTFIEVIEYLLFKRVSKDKEGNERTLRYVLTGKFNQDCLEVKCGFINGISTRCWLWTLFDNNPLYIFKKINFYYINPFRGSSESSAFPAGASPSRRSPHSCNYSGCCPSTFRQKYCCVEQMLTTRRRWNFWPPTRIGSSINSSSKRRPMLTWRTNWKTSFSTVCLVCRYQLVKNVIILIRYPVIGIKTILSAEDPRDGGGGDGDMQLSTTNDKIVYYICGYINRKYGRSKNSCPCCAKTINVGFEDLPEDFNAHHLTLNKTQGGLRFVSTKMFYLMNSVESQFLEFCEEDKMFENNSFADFLYNLCFDKLPKVGCEQHEGPFMTNLIYDYVVLRFKAVGKQKRQELCDFLRTMRKGKRKQANMLWLFSLFSFILCLNLRPKQFQFSSGAYNIAYVLNNYAIEHVHYTIIRSNRGWFLIPYIYWTYPEKLTGGLV